MHHVTDETGDPVWSGKELIDAFEWLVENNIQSFRVDAGPRNMGYLIQIARA